MLVSTAITRIKTAGHDISDEYSNERCLEFLNNSMHQLYGLAIGYNFPPIVREMDLHDDDNLPHNYMKSCGTYPIRITNNIAKLIDDDLDFVRFRYFATPDNLTEESVELPFDHDALNEIIVRGAIILALNENEYDLSQDTALLQTLQQAIAGGMGAGT